MTFNSSEINPEDLISTEDIHRPDLFAWQDGFIYPDNSYMRYRVRKDEDGADRWIVERVKKVFGKPVLESDIVFMFKVDKHGYDMIRNLYTEAFKEDPSK